MKCCHESVFMDTFATVLAKWRARAGSTARMAFWAALDRHRPTRRYRRNI